MLKIPGFNLISGEEAFNFLYNASFELNFRSTSTGVANTYFWDRWHYWDGVVNASASLQNAAAPTFPGVYMRIDTSGTGYLNMAQALDTRLVNRLKGKKVCFSVYMRRNSTLPVNYNLITIEKNSSADTLAGTWTTIGSAVPAPNISSGTSGDWANHNRFYCTATIPDDGTANGLRLCIRFGTAAPNGSRLEVAMAMLNIGSYPSPWIYQNENIVQEIEACKYFFERKNVVIPGWIQSANTMIANIDYVKKRVTPSALTSPTGNVNLRYGPGGETANAFSVLALGPDWARLQASNAGGMTTNTPGEMVGDFLIDAEIKP